MKFKDRNEAKLYAKSFLQWCYTAVIRAPQNKATKSLAKSLRDLNDAVGYLVKSYEDEIKQLKEEQKK